MRINYSDEFLTDFGVHPSRAEYNVVSKSTQRAYDNPICMLGLRLVGERRYAENILIFNINPQRYTFERKAKVAIQEGMHGYQVLENGLTAPHFKIQGNFGWQTVVKKLPSFIPAFTGRTADFTGWVNDWIDPQWSNTSSGGSYWNDFINPLATSSSTLGKNQVLDGRQSWKALEEIVSYYFETNQKRLAKGDAPFEMVWYDTLHSVNWVVVPKGMPELERTLQTQGVHPYSFEMIGVYDNLRSRPTDRRDLWT